MHLSIPLLDFLDRPRLKTSAAICTEVHYLKCHQADAINYHNTWDIKQTQPICNIQTTINNSSFATALRHPSILEDVNWSKLIDQLTSSRRSKLDCILCLNISTSLDELTSSMVEGCWRSYIQIFHVHLHTSSTVNLSYCFYEHLFTCHRLA